jgi:hypothetical protein
MVLRLCSFFNTEDNSKNLFQVTNQISLEGSYKNRYDVTLLVNGLPLVQIELKRSASKSKKPSTKSIATRTILFGATRSVSIRAIVCNKRQSNIWPTINCNRSNKPSFGQMPIIKHTELTEFAAFFKPCTFG